MERTFKEALRHRRSHYALAPESPIDDVQIEEIVRFAIKHVPSAFNSQSTRAVLLLHEHHEKLWQIVKRTLRAIVPEDTFPRTEEKINNCFAAGYGTVLFFEDENIVRGLQQSFPTYAGNFPVWSEHTSAMHQLTIWTMLEDAGFGASLQHYNPLIDNDVRREWNLPAEWRLIAQMPFGLPIAQPGEKSFNPVSERIRVFR
ncbi:nitroreductase family protein [uncultured Alistipes sp.]|jgi:predicted oxidoreductase related to nitroreductase|uniref:nitroreductase family protein n=1 Tax=uncultured Alistipes sp. TaxID=538949 RepID=UPI0025F548EA|nr:nitroreductase family protein [uncultured Alistipes sp.]